MKFFNFFAVIVTFVFTFAANANECVNAGTDIDAFMEASVGEILRISERRYSPEAQKEALENLLFDCVDVRKVSARVLGGAKWRAMDEEERKNFLEQYPEYFVMVFADLVLSTVRGMKDFNFKKAGVENEYQINFIPQNKKEKGFSINLAIERKDGRFFIVDGKFAEASIVVLQKQLFDRLYDENPENVKQFNAKKYIQSQK